MTKPIRIQLSRAKGFNLQTFGRSANGLETVNCARPSQFGNPFIIGKVPLSGYNFGEPVKPAFSRLRSANHTRRGFAGSSHDG